MDYDEVMNFWVATGLHHMVMRLVRDFSADSALKFLGSRSGESHSQLEQSGREVRRE